MGNIAQAMSYRYGEAFEKLGMPGMGHLGADWCAVDPNGTLVLMSHEKYIKRKDGIYVYETPVNGIAPANNSSAAARSRALLERYFAQGKPIILIIAKFKVDGHYSSDAIWVKSSFQSATGDAYHARMQLFSSGESYLLCHLDRKVSF